MTTATHTKNNDTEDLIVWPDNSWCYRHELHEFSWKSDDYYTLHFDTPAYYDFLNKEAELTEEYDNRFEEVNEFPQGEFAYR